MKISTKQEIFVIAPTKITPNEIREQRRAYIMKYKKEPQILRLDPNSYNTLRSFHPEELDFAFGLKIDIDYKLQENEWRLGISHEVISEKEI